jgi:hypothetical protein
VPQELFDEGLTSEGAPLRLVERLVENGSRRDRALVALTTYGGVQPSQVASLNVGDFAVDLGSVTFAATMATTNR